MKLNDIYRSDERFDTMGAAQQIVDMYDEVYDMGGEQKRQMDEVLRAYDISGEDAEKMFRKLLTIHPQQLSKLVRNITRVTRR